jgi:hypothetical protein
MSLSPIKQRAFQPSLVQLHGPFRTEEGYATFSATYEDQPCLLQTPKCKVVAADWDQGFLDVEIPSTEFGALFRQNLEALESHFIDAVVAQKESIFPGHDVADETMQRMFRSSLWGADRTLLRLDVYDPSEFRAVSPDGEVVSLGAGLESAIRPGTTVVSLAFHVSGVSFGQRAWGVAHSTGYAKLYTPPPPVPIPEPAELPPAEEEEPAPATDPPTEATTKPIALVGDPEDDEFAAESSEPVRTPHQWNDKEVQRDDSEKLPRGSGCTITFQPHP